MPSSPYHVYLDLDVINNDYSSNSPPQLRFEENRNAAFLDGDSKTTFVPSPVSPFRLQIPFQSLFQKSTQLLLVSIRQSTRLPLFIPRREATRQFIRQPQI